MRLGDLDALKKAIIEPLDVNDVCKNDWYEGYYTAKNEDVMAIDNAPTVSFMISPDYVTELQNRNKELIKQLEEVERPQGEWIVISHSEQYKMGVYKCNSCGYKNPVPDELAKNYCPHCGADMRGEEE